MITEYKISTLENIKRINSKGHIVVGHEGCIYRALNIKIIDCVENACAAGMEIRFVTPITPEKYINVLKTFILKLAKIKPIKVTFNDYGMLYASLDLINEGIIIPVLGRILTRSIIDCPWYDKILYDEDDIIRSAVIGNTFFHDSKMKLLKQNNVNEIEINGYALAFIKQLKTYELKISVRMDGFLISTARVCYTMYWNNHNSEQCRFPYMCDKKINIELIKKWSKKQKMLAIPTIKDKEYYNDIYVKGNQIFSEVLYEPYDYFQYIDSVIVELNDIDQGTSMKSQGD